MLHAPTETKITINRLNSEKEFINLARPVLDNYFLALTNKQTTAFLWDMYVAAQESAFFGDFNSNDRAKFAHQLRLVMDLIAGLENPYNLLNGMETVQDPQFKNLPSLNSPVK